MKKIYLSLLISFLFLASKAQVVLNEIYGGGGNASSTWKNDFIELYNNSGSPVSLAGWSVQYASATGTTWQVTNLSGSIPANGHYLIQEAQGAGGTSNLPTPDATGTIAMSATAGKVILCNVTTAQSGSCPSGAQIKDLVGFGTTANCFEGAGPTPAPSNTASVQRSPEGNDNNVNSTDFAVLSSPTPTNSGIDLIAPTISSTFPANLATNVITAFTATITFSETIQKGASGTITVKKFSDNSVVQTTNITSATVTVSGATVNFEINSLAFSTQYYVEITSGAFKDLSNNDFAGISGNGTWSFTTAPGAPAGALATTYNFNTCGTTLPDGFVQYSLLGDQKWGCTTFGADATHTPTGSAPNGLQINGFLVTNIPNEDWLISPSFDLTSTTYPLLSFWSRTKFNGLPLQLKVSTNYPGTGDPRNYTWTDINGKFPAQTTDVWTLSNNINLSAYKSASVFVAFVYTSSSDDGARWTLDDIQIVNSGTPPPASLTLSTNDIQFGFASSGNSVDKSFIVTGNDITSDITLTSTSNFTLSTNSGGPFSSPITLLQASANNVPTTVYARFSPAQNNQNFNGTITISTAGVPDTTVKLKGTSIDPATTLEVVNWNMEWFGSPTLGPTNDNQQQSNAQTILQNVGADLYGLVEVVDETRLASIVSNMPGYAYIICNYGSHVNPNESNPTPLNQAQKEAFVYKTSVFSNITTTALLSTGINTAGDLSNPDYDYWASGRFPFMLTADVTLNGTTKTIRFVLIHAKANTSPTTTSYNRRKSGSDDLHAYLNSTYPTDNIVILGDYNDDLDQTITDGINPPTTSYSAFTTDNTNFSSPTLALSLAGEQSTVSYHDMIDHVYLSNEMSPNYMNNTANVLTDVTSLVSNYGNTTSDHYPVFTRYQFAAAAPLPVTLLNFNAIKQNNTTKVYWSTAQEINSRQFVIERSADGINFSNIGTTTAAGNSSSVHNYEFIDPYPFNGVNFYRLKTVDLDGHFSYSTIVKIIFSKDLVISVRPNPATDHIEIVANDNAVITLQLTDISGKLIRQQNSVLANGQPLKIFVTDLQKGVYLLKMITSSSIKTEKIVIQ